MDQKLFEECVESAMQLREEVVNWDESFMAELEGADEAVEKKAEELWCVLRKVIHDHPEVQEALSTLLGPIVHQCAIDNKAGFLDSLQRQKSFDITEAEIDEAIIELTAIAFPRSKSTKKKETRGRPSDTDHDADRRIYEAWETDQYKTYEDLAREKGVKRRVILLALQRHRARLSREA